MATFEVGDETWRRRDFALLQNGHVVLFRRPAVLASSVAELSSLGDRVVQLDAGAWETSRLMHERLAAALTFPKHYGHTMDALTDRLAEVARYDDGSDREAEGLVLVLDGYDAFAQKERRDAEVFTDIFATVARQALLFGHRMLCLLRVDEARFTLPPTGATPVLWNPQEWLDSARR